MENDKTKNNVVASSILICKTANEWLAEAKDLPPIAPLFAPLWYEGETCFFFGKTGIGKTAYAMQIGAEISKTQPVLYCDFELSERQLFKRYQNNGEPIKFSDMFYRIELKTDEIISEKKIFDEIKTQAIAIESKVLIIDNITWLLQEGQEAKNAIRFMRAVSLLKKKLSMSILIIAHTPKRDKQFPIEINDMAGSMALQNFIDSSFAIGESSIGNDLRYIKQTKCRSDEVKLHENNVKVVKLRKDDSGYLGYEFVCYDKESNHLKIQYELNTKEEEVGKLKEIDMSYREIGKKLGISHTQARRLHLKK